MLMDEVLGVEEGECIHNNIFVRFLFTRFDITYLFFCYYLIVDLLNLIIIFVY